MRNLAVETRPCNVRRSSRRKGERDDSPPWFSAPKSGVIRSRRTDKPAIRWHRLIRGTGIERRLERIVAGWPMERPAGDESRMLAVYLAASLKSIGAPEASTVASSLVPSRFEY